MKFLGMEAQGKHYQFIKREEMSTLAHPCRRQYDRN
jgi:hypothetical protein